MMLRRMSLLCKPVFPRKIVYSKGRERLLPVCLYSTNASSPMEASRTVRDAAGRPLTVDITEAAEEVQTVATVAIKRLT